MADRNAPYGSELKRRPISNEVDGLQMGGVIYLPFGRECIKAEEADDFLLQSGGNVEIELFGPPTGLTGLPSHGPPRGIALWKMTHYLWDQLE